MQPLVRLGMRTSPEPGRSPGRNLRMIAATTENIAGHRTVQTLGQCFGVVVRSRGLGGNIMASLRTIVGGEIHEYTRLLEGARRHPLDRRGGKAPPRGGKP